MTLLAFLLGLFLGIGIWLWQQRRLKRQLGKILGVLQPNVSSASLSVVSQLRSEIALAQQYREELQRELQIRQRLLQVAPLGYLQVDEENRLLWCNEQARQLLKIDRWEPGQLRLLLEVVRSYELDQLIEQTRERQQPNVYEWVFHPPYLDGEVMPEVRSLALKASSWPLPARQVGVFLENQQPLVERAQSRNQWVSDLAHELRTPLTSIRLVAETLQGRLKPPERRWVEQMLQEINRLIALVQDLLELSNLEKNPSQSFTYQSIELRSLIQSAWQTLEPLAQQKQLHLAYEASEPICIKGDRARLTQVFLNLIDNSIKHSPIGGAIQVEVHQLTESLSSQVIEDTTTLTSLIPSSPPTSGTLQIGQWNTLDSQALGNRDIIQIDIIDAGVGFSESDLPHVFERLYRGDASRQRSPVSSGSLEASRSSSGSGLGLAIVKQIIQAHNGTVGARNHPETGGAWLQIKLPL
ncbi:MAG TPA: ATP-binding protein [Coleofasciculaceae cyanobacterium]